MFYDMDAVKGENSSIYVISLAPFCERLLTKGPFCVHAQQHYWSSKQLTLLTLSTHSPSRAARCRP